MQMNLETQQLIMYLLFVDVQQNIDRALYSSFVFIYRANRNVFFWI